MPAVPKTVSFNVTRQESEFIRPAKVTPNGLKELSIFDEMLIMRNHASVIQFYRRSDLGKGKDPTHVIKEAIAQTLVYYYPLAGRLREIGCKKTLVVDCTGEGVMFVEADANVNVDDFGDVIHPLIPGADDLLFNPMPGSLLGSPLLLFQVTRLKCGGFTLGTTFNHVIADGKGVFEFLRAVSEIARGLPMPSVPPVWQRHLLRARNPPKVTFKHQEFDQEPDTNTPFFSRDEKMVDYTFIFDPPALSCLRKFTDDLNVPYCSTFELISAAAWSARTISLKLDPTVPAIFEFPVDARNKFNPPIPAGYYGNTLASKVAVTTAGELKANMIEHALKVIKKSKEEVTEDYMNSMMDFMALHGLFMPPLGNAWCVSDIRRIGLHEIDYGWGKPVYGGTAKVNIEAAPGLFSSLFPVSNQKENTIEFGLSMSLPEPIMNSFVNELNVMMGRVPNGRIWRKITSTLFR